MAYPRLRMLTIRAVQQYGRPYLLLQDPARLTDKILLVPQPLALVLALCDGTRNAQQMAHAFTRQHGVKLAVHWVEELLAALDEAIMLENEWADRVHAERLGAIATPPFAHRISLVSPTRLRPMSSGIFCKGIWKLPSRWSRAGWIGRIR